jgi:Uma2 family endonuclease
MATTRQWTVEALEQSEAPAGRYELINGELVEMCPSGDKASSSANLFAFFITGHVRPRRLGRVYSADGGFVLFPGLDLVRVPDVAFVRADRLPPESERDKFPRLAPDLVVEVISPTDSMASVLDKVKMWLDAGVRLLWLADPRARTVTVYVPGREPNLLNEQDELTGGDVLPGFRVRVADCFE